MVFDYTGFISNLHAMIKIRSANYIESDCDVSALVDTVYEDIQDTVLLEIIKQEYVTEGLEEFSIKNFDTTVVTTMTEKYTDVLDIVDEDDVSIMKYIHFTDTNTWRWDNSYCTYEEYPTGSSIFFIRKKITSIDF